MAITNGALLNSVPAAQQQTLSSNYLDLASTANEGWAQQYVPDLMEKEAEVFGPRTISGFLEQVGAEEAMTADQVVWSEQGRLHLSYKGNVSHATAGADPGTGEGNIAQVTIETDIDETSGFTAANHGIRVNDTIIVSNVNGVFKCLVSVVNGAVLDVLPYGSSALAALTTTKATTILVYGSEYGKGQSYVADAGTTNTTTARGANEPTFKSFSNKPIIMKDYYEVSGSDASRIGWVEVSSEGGASGYLWYLKAESDTRSRFNDYVEMAMLESEFAATSSEVQGSTILPGSTTNAANDAGSEGLFAAIESRGNVTSGISGVNAATDLAEFDAILAEFDKQGAIEEYMMFVNRASSLAIDDMLASMNSYGAGGTSYGVFNNDEDMALNLGFSGFRRGSYDFYKSDFRYLNDLATRGGINAASAANAIRGVFIPAGTSSVYDQTVGASMKRPFLHVRYRASQTDDRRMKTWTTGSVGAATSALDAMQIHMLTERCLITQGANNFMLMK
tara:strand:+ start:2770 stop:4287 length:1518 start_codon:yes stop_codon:yes gene_type:complete